ncbi:apolipoprotein N-acyltransferase [Halopseudomonas laoshanensis]|uniref:apolipoprotein N-acyltransferase n=1 Tax=Halopseudomonas laoshanensis TaxID=2268758 RepID=UPI00293482E4|nr:apolipoprotein N-acyltransferase [Pseudomonas sp. NyZ704]
MPRLDSASSALDIPLSRSELATLGWLPRVLLALAGGLLMGLPWFDQAMYWTAWFGSVPLLFALQGVRWSSALLLGSLTGVAYFSIASYWIIQFLINLRDFSWPIAALLSSVFWCFAGFSIGLSCALFRWLSTRLPTWDLLSFPLCMVVMMSVYPLLFGAYYAEPQAQFLMALQGVSLFGVQALDMLILMTGVLVFQFITGQGRGQRFGQLLALAVLAAWFIYGLISLHHWDDLMGGWDVRRVGLVQPDDAVTLAVPEPPAGFSREYPPEMAAVERLAQAGAELVIWPEARYKGYFDNYSVRLSYAEKLRASGVSLILHDAERAWEGSQKLHFNALAYLDGDGEQRGVYRKMRLMPFGEYLPTFFHLPGIGWLTRTFFGEFLTPLEPGQSHEIFNVNGMRIVPKICYETAFPAFIAHSIGQDAAGKVLLFVSQDNWFGETTQPFQHSAMSVVRGVENRVPMIHLINNGPSVVAAPNGRIIAETDAFTPAELLAAIPHSVSAGGSFYSRYPWLLSAALYVGLASLVLMALGRRQVPKR